MVVAHEAFFNLKKFMSKKHAMAMKHDVHKAYDWVEWSFFRKVLFHFGSIETWVNLVMQCMTTINYSILINSVPSVLFSPSRELRQRFIVSIYIFICNSSSIKSHCKFKKFTAVWRVKTNKICSCDNSYSVCEWYPSVWCGI